MRDEASILHADLDAFYASVEQRDDPRLRSRPVIVGSGVVLAASYEARAYGVRTAMGCGLARRLCPPAIVVEPRISAYSEASKAVFEVFKDTTPMVEGISIDEAFLDVGGLKRVSGSPTEIARRLRRQVLEEVGLPITVGAARTKFLAKVAQRALGRSLRSPADLDAILIGLVERVTRRMRTAGRVSRTVILRLRFDDFSRATRSHTLPRATAHTQTILLALRDLLADAMPMIEVQGLTLVGVAMANLDDDEAVQLVLPFDREAGMALDDTLDNLNARFGSSAVTRAVLLGKDQGMTVPLLPD